MIIEACVSDCMKRRVISVTGDTSVQEAARLVVEEHIGTLPVVDKRGVLTGVVSLHDLLRVFMPDFVALLDNIDFVPDFGALERVEPQAAVSVAKLTMAELAGPPLAVRQDSGLMHALATIVKHRLDDLPIVDQDGRLVGIASRVDIAVEFFAQWTAMEAQG